MASCNEEVIEKVSTAVKLGVPPLVAAMGNGIGEAEFVEWMRRGSINSRGDNRYAKFYEKVVSAESDCEALLVGRIRSAASDNWNAAAWLLERRFPERYIRKSISNPEAPPGSPGQPDPFDDLDKVVPLKAAAGKKT